MTIQVSQIKLTTVLALLLAFPTLVASASTYSVDDGFKADANDNVYSLAVQDDGKIIVGGKFTTIAGQPRTRVARLLANGDIDTSFAATALDGNVNTVTPPSTEMSTGLSKQ